MESGVAREIYNQGNYEAIAKAMEQVSPIEIQDTDLLLVTADSYAETGDGEKSCLWYERLVELRPESHFLARLFKLYGSVNAPLEKWEALYEIAKGRNETELVEGLEYQIAKRNGSDDTVLIELLSVLVKGDFEEELLFDLAELYDRVGNQQKKNFYLRKILSKTSDEKIIARANSMMNSEIAKPVQETTIPQTVQESPAPKNVISSVRDYWENHTSSATKKRRERKVTYTIGQYFDNVVGMSEIKKEITALYNDMNMNEDFRASGEKGEALAWNFFIGGEEGSGKTMLAGILCQILYDQGKLMKPDFKEINAISLTEDCKEFMEISEGVVIVSNTELLLQDTEADTGKKEKHASPIWVLLSKCLEKAYQSGKLYYIFTGERDAMSRILAENTFLQPQIQLLQIPTYSQEELFQLGKMMLKQKGYSMDEKAEECFYQLIKRESTAADFANGHSVKRLMNEIQKNVAVKYGDNMDIEDLRLLQEDDFIITDEVGKSLEELMQELDSFIGLASVKKDVHNKIAFLRLQEERRKKGKKVEPINLHTLLLGAAGTGKTSVAKLLGKIYGKMGLLPRGDVFVEADKGELVAGYEGQTALKVKELVKKAMGGVLFIDEAYSLVRKKDDDPFGTEALTTLLKLASDYQDRIMIIMAGYEEDMQKLLDTNQGMRRRFPNILYFNDYTGDELYQIFESKVAAGGYTLHEDAVDPVKQLIKRRSKTKDFGNGGGVDNIYAGLVQAMALRNTNSDSDVNEIRAEDVTYYLGKQKDSEKTLEDYKEELNKLIGLQAVKDEVETRIGILENEKRRRSVGLDKETVYNLHTVFLGNPGTGKTTVAKLLAKIYNKMGILPDSNVYVDASRAKMNSAQDVAELVDKAIGGVLFIDEAYSLVNGDGDVAGTSVLNELVNLSDKYKGQLMIIMAGYEKEMQRLIRQNPGLESRFPNQLHFQDYNEDELYQIFCFMMSERQNRLASDSEYAIRDLIRKRNVRKDFGNARGVSRLVDEVCAIAALRTNKIADADRETLSLILKEDVEKAGGVGQQKEVTLEECLAKLNNMVGLQNVKEQVNTMVDVLQVEKERSKRTGKPYSLGNMHMLFLGSPGTGKTTVARLVGQIYGLAGIIKSGDTFVEVTRSNFVGKYQGFTEANVMELIEKASGGVLFIDEAYSLVTDEQDSFGKNALNALIAPIENNKNDMVVIMAGYEKDMDELMSRNEGLSSRMKNKIYFEDYSLDEMCRIFYNIAEATEPPYHIEEGLADEVKEFIRQKANADKNFGNARGVRKCFVSAKEHLDRRLALRLHAGEELSTEEMYTIKREDLV